MTIQANFITALQHIKIADNLGRGDRLDDSTFITNDRDVIAKLLKPEMVPIIGSLEARAIRDAPAIIYSSESLPSAEKGFPYLLRKLSHVTIFQQVLWMGKDNSVNNELAFVHFGRGSTFTVHSTCLQPCILGMTALFRARHFRVSNYKIIDSFIDPGPLWMRIL